MPLVPATLQRKELRNKPVCPRDGLKSDAVGG